MDRIISFITNPSLILLFTIFTAVVFGALGSSTYFYIQAKEIAAVQSIAADRSERLAGFLAERAKSKLENDPTETQSFLNSIINAYPNVQLVWLEYSDGENTRLEASSGDILMRPTSFEKTIAIYTKKDNEKATAATLGVQWNLHEEYKTITDRLKDHALKISAILGLILILFIGFGYWFLSRPLKYLRLYQEDLITNRFIGINSKPHGFTPSELDNIIKNMDKFAHKFQRFSAREKEITAIFDTALDCIIGINKRGEITTFNNAAQATFGYSYNEAIGAEMSSLIIPEKHRSAHKEGMTHYFKTGEEKVLGKRIEIEALRRDGSLFPVELAIAKISEAGEVGFVAYLRDISDRRRDEGKLLAATKAAKSSMDAKSDLIKMFSREIQTPLKAIEQAFHTLAQNRFKRDDNLIETGNNAVNFINNFARDIGDFSELNAGEIILKSKPFQTAKLFQSVIDICGLIASGNNSNIEFEVASDLPKWLTGDPDRIKQIFLSLLSNSLKETSADILTVRLKNIPVDIYKTKIRIEIEGSREGNAIAGLKKILEASDDIVTLKEASLDKSTAFGLAVSKGLVTIMDGSIGIIEGTNKSQLWFEIPLITSELSAQSKLIEEGQPITQDQIAYDLKNRDILIVEDNRTNALIINAMIKKLGGNGVIASTGKQALELIDKGNFVLILMDISLPDMDGFSVAKEIQKNHKLNVPIAAITAHALPNIRRKALDAGMINYIQKPVSLFDLQKLIAGLENPSDAPTELLNVNIVDTIYHEAGNEILNEMFDLLKTDFRNRMKALKQHFKADDFLSIEQEAHYMRGSSGAYGLVMLEQALKQIELECLNNNLNNNPVKLETSIQELEQIVKDSLSALSQQIHTYNSEI